MAARIDHRKSLAPDGLIALLLVLAVVLVYQPVWHAGFIWDDDDHVTANPCVIGPLGLKEIWTTDHARYYPLVTTTFWLEHKLWALAPVPYHLVNVLMHAACAVVLWQVLRRLNVAGAWLGAALWALHPVEVETVAWITEMKNTQSGLFYLLAIFFFAGYLRKSNTAPAAAHAGSYALALVCAALAMASKSSAVVLPLVFCLCAWWIDGRVNWRHQVRVLPVFLMAAAAALLAVWTVDLQGVNEDREWLRSWPERFITAGNVIWFYLGKLAWPHPLIFIYPRWTLDATRPLSWLPLIVALILLLLLVVLRGKVARALLFAYAYFLIALLPVLGLVEHYFLRYSFVADHLQYLAAIGPLALAGSVLARLPGDGFDPRLRTAFCAGFLVLLGALSWQRAHVFESQETLWADTLAKNPDCWLAENNLGDRRMESGHVDEAIDRYRQALRIKPNLFATEFNLGAALARQGRIDEALEHYRRALQINPDYGAAHINRGLIFLQRGQVDQAIAENRAGLRSRPDLAIGHFNLANALMQKGAIDEAMAEYGRALALKPDYTKAHYYLGNALLKSKQFDAAIGHYHAALTLEPTNAGAHNNLGIALAQTGHPEQALAEFALAVQLDPGFTDAQRNLALAQEAAAKQSSAPAK